MSKTITFTLDPESIENAIKELNDYEKSFEEKLNEVAKRFAERIQSISQNYYSASVADVTFPIDNEDNKGDITARRADVTVTVEKEGDETFLVVADGEDAVFVEFGSGVRFNGAVGTSRNPWGYPLGYTIGSFSTKFVGWRAWPIKSHLWSYGTPAQRPLYNATQEAIHYLPDIVQEVFAFG